MFSYNRLSIVALLFSAINTASALPSQTSAPIPPLQDPWYKAPAGYEHAQAGQVLKIRHAPGNLTTIFSNSSAVYNILFSTVNAHYEPFWAVTTLCVPKHTNGTSLLSYQIPYNTADLNGSPSYILYGPENSSEGSVNDDINTALGNGWYVSIPDFEGPLASFFTGVQEGVAVLDSVRAVLNKGLGLKSNAKSALWGYSGGSFASEWAAELQAAYAPEVNLAGAALGGLVVNLTSLIDLADKTQFAGLVPETYLGLTSQYQAAREYLVSQLKPEKKARFLKALDMNIEHAFAFYANESIISYFKNGNASLQAPVLDRLTKQAAQLGYHGIPSVPLFVYKAIHDELAPIADVDPLIQRYCNVDVNILYERNTVGGHLAELYNGDGRALAWLNSIFAGTYQQSGCTIKDVTVNITDTPV